jgi:hypothetical protein
VRRARRFMMGSALFFDLMWTRFAGVGQVGSGNEA